MKRKIFSFLTVFISFLAMVGGVKADYNWTEARNNGTSLSSSASHDAIPDEYKFSFAKPVSYDSCGGGISYTETSGQGWDTPHENYGSVWGVDQYDKRKPTRAKNADKSNIVNGGYYAIYKNIDVYNNKKISVKATLVDYLTMEGDSNYNLPADPIISFAKTRVGVYTAGIKWVKVKYEFFDTDTNQPINGVKGNTSYWDIDLNQGIVVADDSHVGLYATDNTKLFLSTIDGKKYVFDKSNDNNTDDNDVRYSYSETFNTGSSNSLTRIYQFDRFQSPSWLLNAKIVHKAMAPVPVPPKDPVKSVNKNDITDIVKANSTFQYTIKQEVPEAIPVNYYKSFKFTDVLKNVLEPKTITIYKDSTNSEPITWFNTNINGQTVTATLTNPNTAEFYGHTYYFVITAKVKENLTEDNLKEWKNGNVYKVPNTAKINITNSNNQNIEKETNEVTVYWSRETEETIVNVPSTGAGIPLHVLITGLFILLSAGGSFGYMKYKNLI